MTNQKVKIVNKRTREQRVLTLNELKAEFSKELQEGFKTYSEERERKEYLHFKNNNYESDFYFPGSFRFNFNNYVNSEWYIENFV